MFERSSSETDSSLVSAIEKYLKQCNSFQILIFETRDMAISTVYSGKSRLPSLKVHGNSASAPSTLQPPTTASTSSNNERTRFCEWYGLEKHPMTMCPAKDATCKKCGKKRRFPTLFHSGTAVRSVEVKKPWFLGLAAHCAYLEWDVVVIVSDNELLFNAGTGADETVPLLEASSAIYPRESRWLHR